MLTFDGGGIGAGGTIFDTTFEGEIGTDGSSLGYTFEVTRGEGDLDIVATYRDAVRLTAVDDPIGDLFRRLEINFAGNGTGLAKKKTLKFRADTDNAGTAGDIIPDPPNSVVPAPTNLTLLAFAAFSLTCYGWWRRKPKLAA